MKPYCMAIQHLQWMHIKFELYNKSIALLLGRAVLGLCIVPPCGWATLFCMDHYPMEKVAIFGVHRASPECPPLLLR